MENAFPRDQPIYEVAGIGIGPFNLGLAALCHTIGLPATFIEQATEFNWHAGLLIDDATLQVPFYADLVTPVDPCSRFSFMSYLHAQQRLFRFAIRETNYIKRTEYNAYCRWVVKQLPTLRFGATCQNILYNDKLGCYQVSTTRGTYLAKRIVLGVGTVPYLPAFAKSLHHPLCLHSANYLDAKPLLLQQHRLAIVGSGQSAAEIFYDLLKSYTGSMAWFTRADGFYPMDNSKFSLEKTSLDYIDYFYSLDPVLKSRTLAGQHYLYKGINSELLSNIYAALDDRPDNNVSLHPDCELTGINLGFQLHFYHRGLGQPFSHQTDAVVFATGYHWVCPGFLQAIQQRIQWDAEYRYQVNRNYSIDANNSIFVQNAESHTHGFNAADLGMGTYRNAEILNTILGYEHFKLEKDISFQRFGLPKQ